MGKKKSKRGKKPGRARKSRSTTSSSGRGPRATDSSPLSRLGDKGKGEFRIPSIVMIPVCAGVTWFITGGWPGAIFGGIVGVFLWRMRA